MDHLRSLWKGCYTPIMVIIGNILALVALLLAGWVIYCKGRADQQDHCRNCGADAKCKQDDVVQLKISRRKRNVTRLLQDFKERTGRNVPTSHHQKI
jgi:hypothetical protein